LQRQELIDLARGAGADPLERSIDLLVSRLRSKLADDARAPQLIRTVRGVGYLFAALDDEFGAPVCRPGHGADDQARHVGSRMPIHPCPAGRRPLSPG